MSLYRDRMKTAFATRLLAVHGESVSLTCGDGMWTSTRAVVEETDEEPRIVNGTAMRGEYVLTFSLYGDWAIPADLVRHGSTVTLEDERSLTIVEKRWPVDHPHLLVCGASLGKARQHLSEGIR